MLDRRTENYQSHLHTDKTNAKYRADIAWALLSAQCDPSSLLDIGCGSGELLKCASREGVNDIHGVDQDASYLAELDQIGINLQQLDIEAEPLPYADQYFEAVTCLEVLEHLYDPLRLVQEVARVLKPGGIAVISVPNPYAIIARLHVLFGKNISPPLTVGGHIKFFQEKDLRRMCTAAQLDIQQIKGYPYPTAVKRYGRLIEWACQFKPGLFATWWFCVCQKKIIA